MELKDIHIVYFIGIGGIGMSALARYFNMLGCEVYGYDRVSSRITKELEDEGISIHYTEDISAIPEKTDLVIYTPAIPDNHQELVWLRKESYPVKKRAEILGMISRTKKTVAVAGTHGKTTTSSIITHILRTGGVECTAFLGGIANNFESNFIFGKSEWVVVEADEFDRSFLHLNPFFSIITSTDADHLDIYGDHDEMKRGFAAFSKKNHPEGRVFAKRGLDLPSSPNQVSYGLEQGENKAINIRVENGHFVFDFENEKTSIKDIIFTLPGRHNVENATAAISVALQIGITPSDIKKALSSFKGIWRRFDFVLRENDFVYIDDYAHHPTELEAAISATKELYPEKEITGVFQPHLYTRTRDFAEGFAKALDLLDYTMLMEIYPARELPIEGVTSGIIYDRMENPNKKRVSKENLLHELKLSDPKVLLTLGAGDIDRFILPIKQLFTNNINSYIK